MMSRLRSFAPLVVLALGLAVRAEAAVPVARVLETKGKVVLKDKSQNSREVGALDTVYLDERIVLAAGSAIVLAFRDNGHLERLSQPGEVTVRKDGCEPKTAVEILPAPERHKRLVSATVMSLHPKGTSGVSIARTASGDAPRIRLSPIPGSTVLSVQPRLAWSAVPGARRYEVKIERDSQTVWTATTSSTSLNYPGKPPLKPGATYVWEVTATLADGSAGEASYGGAFTVATEERAARASELRALAAGSDVPYLTLAAAWLEENNFVPEAVAAYERLVALRPGTAPYYFALTRLYQQADRQDEAQKAYAKGRQLQPLPLKPPRPEWPPKE
jgi:hypothetical protein